MKILTTTRSSTIPAGPKGSVQDSAIDRVQIGHPRPFPKLGLPLAAVGAALAAVGACAMTAPSSSLAQGLQQILTQPGVMDKFALTCSALTGGLAGYGLAVAAQDGLSGLQGHPVEHVRKASVAAYGLMVLPGVPAIAAGSGIVAASLASQGNLLLQGPLLGSLQSAPVATLSALLVGGGLAAYGAIHLLRGHR